MTRMCGWAVVLASLALAGCHGVAANLSVEEADAAVSRLTPAISADDLAIDAAFLASDECAGRLTGSPGAERASRYIAAAMERAGLQPGGVDGYYQPVEFAAGVQMVRDATGLEVVESTDSPGEPAQLGADFNPRTFSASGTAEGEVVFAGYGLVEPGSAGQGYDSYGNLEVKGKIVLALRDLPEEVTPERRQELALYAGDRYKAKLAADRGAAGFLLVTGPNSPQAGKVVKFRTEDRTSSVPIVAASISGKLADRLLAGAQVDLKKLQGMLDGGKLSPHALVTPGSRVRLSVRLERVRKTCRNVIGLVPPAGGCDEYVVVCAHYDHIGTGEGLGSLAKQGEKGQIHNGADDNASGTSVVLEIAAAVADARRTVDSAKPVGDRLSSGSDGQESLSHSVPQRGVVFACWSGEELGLVGSTHFVSHPVVPLDKVVACFNFDMVGRLRDNKLILQAVGSSPVWRRLIERRNIPAGFSLVLQDDPYLPTDATAFYTKGVPILSFFTDLHEDYNRPTDDADRLNYVGMERVAMFARRLIDDVSKPDREVAYARVKRSASPPGRMGRRAYTGTVPDFAASGITGVKLSDVRPGGPADEAGLKAGDVIVELAGQQVNNLQDYSDALMGVKIGQPINIVVEREGRRITLTITPTARPE